MPKDKFTGLLVFLFTILLISFSGYFATIISVDNWYADLKKPSWTPSTWVFAPVWIVLYIMIAFSGWIVWVKSGYDLHNTAMKVYSFQLLCNALWPWLFFAMHNTVFAFIDITALLILIMFNMAYFWRYSPFASLLLFPYLIWVSFAMSINFVIALYDVIEGALK